jgi:hypothetical protein
MMRHKPTLAPLPEDDIEAAVVTDALDPKEISGTSGPVS